MMIQSIKHVLEKIKQDEELKEFSEEEIEEMFYKNLEKGRNYARSRTDGHERGLFYYSLLGGFMSGYIKAIKEFGDVLDDRI